MTPYSRFIGWRCLLGHVLFIACMAARGTIRAQEPFDGLPRPHPLEFLKRHDRNGDGVLSAKEQTGPVRYLLERLRRDVTSLGPKGTAISIQSVIAAYERRREERAR